MILGRVGTIDMIDDLTPSLRALAKQSRGREERTDCFVASAFARRQLRRTRAPRNDGAPDSLLRQLCYVWKVGLGSGRLADRVVDQRLAQRPDRAGDAMAFRD